MSYDLLLGQRRRNFALDQNGTGDPLILERSILIGLGLFLLAKITIPFRIRNAMKKELNHGAP